MQSCFLIDIPYVPPSTNNNVFKNEEIDEIVSNKSTFAMSDLNSSSVSDSSIIVVNSFMTLHTEPWNNPTDCFEIDSTTGIHVDIVSLPIELGPI